MLRCALFILILLSVTQLFGQNDIGSIKGTITNQDKDTMSYLLVVLQDSTGETYKGYSDEFGVFYLNAQAGEYELILSNFGAQPKRKKVLIEAGRILFCDVTVFVDPDDFARIPEIPYSLRYIPNSDRVVIEEEYVDQSVVRFELNQLVQSRSDQIQLLEASNQLVVLGARLGDALLLVDDVKIRGELVLPSASYQKITIYSGGLPAKFGDTIGGVISIETKGYFDLYNERMQY